MDSEQKRIRDILFICVFLISLFGILFFVVFIKEPVLVSTQEKRNLTNFSELNDKSFFDGGIQSTIDSAIADQFVFRYEIVKIKNIMDVKLTNLFIPISDDDYKLTNVGDSQIKRVGNSYYLINGLFEYDEKLEARFIKRAYQINELSKDYPNIEMFVYKPTQVHETSIFDDANEIKTYGEYYRDLLKDNLKIPYAELEIKDIEDYKNYYLQSDHHWSYQGSYQGYIDIVDLMFGDEEKVLEPVNINTFNDEMIFLGSFASRIGYVFPGEPFYLYIFDLPKYEVYMDDEKQKIYDMNTFEENIKHLDSYYIYGVANYTYGPDVIYQSEYNDKETLLLIGDSYAAAVEPLLMEHFSKIYYIQPHDYYLKYWKKFNYDDFLSSHKIDKILFMYTVENYFYVNEYGDRAELFDIHRNEGD
ncbi:MAG: hypothetical protein PHP11_04050 [Erysipelotrichaceae bacterium]|nr:hypothetical protein [Erysipelotrichaceae bacterium]MDD4642662.1 hypothetical protein [Erysipelotrichaceae bacterium]